jgi:hypothetical protein
MALGTKPPRGNNILKVQGLAALEYLKFITFEASAAGSLVALTGWKTAVNCDSEGARGGRRAKAGKQYLGDRYTPLAEFKSNHDLGYSRAVKVRYLGND